MLRKLLFLLIFSLLLAVPVQGSAASADNPRKQLVLLTWTEYMDPDVVAEFEAEFNAEVHQFYFSSDDARERMILDLGHDKFDLMMVNGVSIHKYRSRGWIDALDTGSIPNIRHVGNRWRESFPDANRYGIPYMWGTLGIAYRSDVLSTPVTSWRQIFEPALELQGKIAMIPSNLDLVGIALMALGYSSNSEDREELKHAARLLQRQKPHVNRYEIMTTGENSALLDGTVLAAAMYNGEAASLKAYNPAIKYLIPEEGCNFWVDYWTLSSASGNKDIAYEFLDFINRPEIASRLSVFLNFATANETATNDLPEYLLTDTIVYPGSDELERCEAFTPLAPEANGLRNSIAARIVDVVR